MRFTSTSTFTFTVLAALSVLDLASSRPSILDGTSQLTFSDRVSAFEDNFNLDSVQSASTRHLLKPELVEQIDRIRRRWAVKGLTIGLVASPAFIEGQLGDDAHSAYHAGSQAHAEVDVRQHAVLDDEGWWAETLGFGTADRFGHKVDNETLFSIASNSKLFTVTSVGLLIENNTLLPSGDGATLSWSTKIKDILPADEWALQDTYAQEHADLIDLASMRSGMPRHDQATGVTLGPNGTTADVVANLRNLRPSTEFRQEWQYNNQHYVTLARIVEYLTGLSYPEYAQKHILEPLGMDGSTFFNAIAAESGHRSDGFTKPYLNVTACKKSLERSAVEDEIEVGVGCFGKTATFGWWSDNNSSLDAGPGGVITSSTDITKWIKELLHPTVLPASLVKKFTIGNTVPVGEPDWPEFGVNTYGLGQMIYAYRGHTVHGHTGSVPGQHTRLVRLPDLGLGFLVAVNDDTFGLPLHEIISNLIVDSVLGFQPIDWERRVMRKTINSLPSGSGVPTDPRPYPSTVEGSYHDKGYGVLQVKLAKPADGSPDLEFDSSRIADLLDSITLASPSLNVTGPIYLGSLNSLWVSLAVFTHFDGPLFNWTLVWTPDELSSEAEAVGTEQVARKLILGGPTGTAVFTDHGLGLFGGFWGQGPRVGEVKVVENEQEVEEKAEVWFKRL